ncbi:MAG: TAXI family TRAP transporter solute-binding subunit [Beijerinckiaceae bacterium]
MPRKIHAARLARRNLFVAFPAAVAFAALSASAANAKTFTMATDKVGSTFNAMGTAVAKVITAAGKDRVVVKAFGGPEAYLRGLESGEVDLAVLSSTSAYYAFHGKNKQKTAYKGLRILRAGDGGLKVTFVVPASSNIHSYKDLKGQKVASSYGGHAVIVPTIAGALATVGLSWNDVVQVPVTGVTGGIDAIAAGRAVASWSSYGMPKTRELHAKMGVRYIGFENTPETLKTLREKVFPGIKLGLTKAEPKIGLPKDAYLITYESYILASPKLSKEDATRILQTLWDKTPDLQAAHRSLKGFVKEDAASEIPVVPYHPAAIEFYKAQKLWGDKQEKANAAVAAQVK